MSTRVIISISSDIGTALGRYWLECGHRVLGTYRTESDQLRSLERAGAALIHCDLADDGSMTRAITALVAVANTWDVLVFASGAQEPVGPFIDTNFEGWEGSIGVNFTGQMRLLHGLLPIRNRRTDPGPLVLLFAGGGTNSATLNYSAYTVSKIALIKMCELLDAEIPDARFSIVGPGWVKTKIHHATLAAGEHAGGNHERTVQKLASDECVPMKRIMEFCDWIVDAPREVVGGRNLSLVYDLWGSPEMDELLRHDSNIYKLRRSGNDRLVRPVPISDKPAGHASS